MGILRTTENDEEPECRVTQSLNDWHVRPLEDYRWFETTLTLPLPQVAEHVQHRSIHEVTERMMAGESEGRTYRDTGNHQGQG